MRLGVVLLGLKLNLVDISDLGCSVIAAVVAVVLITFAFTLSVGCFGYPCTNRC